MRATKRKLLSVLLGLSMLLGCMGSSPVSVYSDETQEIQTTDTERKTSEFKASGRIWIAGDSIAADHSYEKKEDYARFVHGWGEMAGSYLTEDAEVFNLAISGQTARFFTEESNYRQIMDGIGEGDLLLIQFGHNDYKSAGTNHWELPTDTEGSYRWYLKHYYIDPALEAGAMPVLCTSVVLCVTNPEIELIDNSQAQNKFARAMRTLYEEYCEQGIEIGFIDTYALTQTYLNCESVRKESYYALKYDYGNQASTSLDRVHFSEAGADMTANMIIQNLMLMYEDLNRFYKTDIVDGGSGTKEDPYLISTWCQLYQVMQDDGWNQENICYKLTCDLYPTLQKQEWKTVFRANLDGNNHTVYNVVGASLRSFVDENYGMIENLHLNYRLNHITEEKQVSFVKENYGTIRNCISQGSAVYRFFEASDNSPWYIGSFAGVNHAGAVIENCTNGMQTEVDGRSPRVYLGGIAGCNSGTIRNCSNTAMLMADTFEYETDKKPPVYEQVICCCGGIAGMCTEGSVIEGCTGNRMPAGTTTLEGTVQVVLSDKLTAVTEEKLKALIEEQKNADSGDNVTGSGVVGTPGASQEPSGSELPGASQKPHAPVKGDLDGDMCVTLKDAQIALRIALNIDTPEENQLQAADLNEDGKTDLEEVREILKAALKITEGL